MRGLDEGRTGLMGNRGVRAAARSAAAATRARLKAELAEKERLRDKLAETVMVQLAARDAAIIDCERAAGQALEQLVTGLGLTAAEASEWCGGVPVRDINRMRRLAHDPDGQGGG